MITSSPHTNPSAAAPAARKPRRILRRVAAGVAVAIVSSGAVVATAQPASAASYVTGCFKFASPYNGAYSNEHVALSLYSGGSWGAVASSTTGYNGCAAFNITGSWRNYPAKITATTRVGSAIFTGQTPYYAYGGSQGNNLGTGIVTCYGCTF